MDTAKTAKLRIMSHNVWCGEVHDRDLHLANIYFRYDPDIIGLQEMTQNLYDSRLVDLLSEKYELLKPDTAGLLDNTPLLIKKGVFNVIKCGWHLYDGLNNHQSKSLAWAVLEIIESGERIGVVSTHFWWKGGLESDIARVYDAKQMASYVHFMETEYHVPVVTMGDLNMNIGAPGYNEIVNQGGLDVHLAATDYVNRSNSHHRYALYNAATNCYEHAPAPEGGLLAAIDHMFVFNRQQLEVKVFNVVDEQEALDVSDHCPIYIDCNILPRPVEPVLPTLAPIARAEK